MARTDPRPTLACPVVMAGGSGTRLWPLSRAQHPKQFLALDGGSLSLFQQAVQRVAALGASDIEVLAPCIVGNEGHRFLMLDQLQASATPAGAIVLEPLGRGTAPAATLAALQAIQDGADPVLVVAPADQTVGDAGAFAATLQAAVRQAASGGIVILGMASDLPDTAAEGNGFRSAGIVVMRASVWLNALGTQRPDILAATRATWDARKTEGQFVRLGRAEFAAVPNASIESAVIDRIAAAQTGEPILHMVALDAAGWGSFDTCDAIWQASRRNADGNLVAGDTLVHDSRNSLVHSTSRLVCVVGANDLVVVETPDAVLVADRRRSQDVEHVVGELQRAKRSEPTLHRQVHRPWGWYNSIDSGPRFQVKRIMVKPGASLSLQMHHHRAEHWIVVSGTAEVTCGERKMLLTENQSTYIPLGEKHRLANPGTIPLEIIEVQSGSYLGEDDIVRFEDTYGRTT